MADTVERYDLVVVGTGSGNSVLTPDFDGWRVALVERDVFGGTCLNRGCIPSKMFVYAADVAHQAGRTGHLGVDSSLDGVRWPEIVRRVFGRIDPIAQGGEDYRHSLDNVNVVKGDARFCGHKLLEVGGRSITGDHIVLAAGARPFIPPIPGLAEVPFHTSDSIMRLESLPDRLVILGGGYIAAELGHVFDALGTEVTIVNRSERLLRAADEDVSATFTDIVSARMSCVLGSPVREVARRGSQIVVRTETRDVVGDALLVATGRVPNGAQLGVEQSGVALDAGGYVVVDRHLRTGVDGVWALGDICNPAQLKHTANEDTRVVAHNIAHPDDLRSPDHSGTPYAVFASPQVGAVGLTEQELRSGGRRYLRAVRHYSDTAYGWAMEDTTSFAKVLADPDTRLLLGAHIIGPQAPTLVQQLVQGMQFGLTVDEMARGQIYIHPALTEVVEQALLEL
ncbi:mycothione reductase [Candidatus Poriferisocius sp.]|uniref:mycothione reductase n=1 Tax=Candidatus Poriferisocius sp. TaxID=3101276 RepID=UPI003B598F9E